MKYVWRILLLVVICLNPLHVIAQDGEDPATPPVMTVTDDHAFGAFLPEGWVMAGGRDEGVFIANTPAVLEAVLADSNYVVAVGEVAMTARILSLTETLSMMELAEDASLVDILTALLELMDTNPTLGVLGTPADTELNERPAAYAEGSSAEMQVGAILYPIAPDTLALGIRLNASGEFETYSDDFQLVMSTFGYSLPLGESHTTDRNFTFDYPTDWIWALFSEFSIVVNDPNILLEESGFTEGKYAFLITDTASLGLGSANLATAAEAVAVGLLAEQGAVAGEPTFFSVQDHEAVSLLMEDEEGANEGGVIIIEKDGESYVVVYLGTLDEAHLIAYSALAILLSIETED